MGQKVNTNLLRLNLKTSNWKSNYYAKTREESTLYLFNDLDIKKYINRIFKIYGLIIKTQRLYCSSLFLKLFISFFLTKKSFKMCKKKKKSYNKQFNFSEYFLESLGVFLYKKFSVIVIFQNLNKSYSIHFKKTELKLLKKACFKFRKFVKIEFFIETLNILILSLIKRDSANLLAEFLAFQIKSLKKQTFFLIVIKQILCTLLSTNIFSTKGIKISIKGRLNGAPRAKLTTILLGNISAQTFKANINHSMITTFTRNGTFGIKIWIQETN